MKVVFITPVTPYKENMRGPSGLPYHLMVKRPKGVDITIYSYNQNHLSPETIAQVEREIDAEIRLIEQPRWIRWILRLHLTFIRLFLKYPIQYYVRLKENTLEEIKSLHPDLVWIYCQEFSGLSRQLEGYRRLHTLPDCYSLHFYRRLALRSTVMDLKEYLRVWLMYRKHYRMEYHYPTDKNLIYHLVGEEDTRFLRTILPNIDARFVRHPHYEIAEPQKEIRFQRPKIRLLFAGRYDLYSQQAADELVAEMTRLTNRGLADAYSVTFLGKGWEAHVGRMRDAGFETSHIQFAPDYIEEIRKHDIQMQPLSVGTGTKGKVLDALANGLLVVGTEYALENIAVKDGVSCLQYGHASEAVDILEEIRKDIPSYEAMAERGRQEVLAHHHREDISKQLFHQIVCGSTSSYS